MKQNPKAPRENLAVVVGNGFVPTQSQVQRLIREGHINGCKHVVSKLAIWANESDAYAKATAIAVKALRDRGYQGTGGDHTMSRQFFKLQSREEFVVVVFIFTDSERRDKAATKVGAQAAAKTASPVQAASRASPRRLFGFVYDIKCKCCGDAFEWGTYAIGEEVTCSHCQAVMPFNICDASKRNKANTEAELRSKALDDSYDAFMGMVVKNDPKLGKLLFEPTSLQASLDVADASGEIPPWFASEWSWNDLMKQVCTRFRQNDLDGLATRSPEKKIAFSTKYEANAVTVTMTVRLVKYYGEKSTYHIEPERYAIKYQPGETLTNFAIVAGTKSFPTIKLVRTFYGHAVEQCPQILCARLDPKDPKGMEKITAMVAEEIEKRTARANVSVGMPKIETQRFLDPTGLTDDYAVRSYDENLNDKGREFIVIAVLLAQKKVIKGTTVGSESPKKPWWKLW